jgi:hypothetical protein
MLRERQGCTTKGLPNNLLLSTANVKFVEALLEQGFMLFNIEKH